MDHNEHIRMDAMMAKAIEELRQFYPGVFTHKNRDAILRIIRDNYHDSGDFKKDLEKLKEHLTSYADKAILSVHKDDNQQLEDEDTIRM